MLTPKLGILRILCIKRCSKDYKHECIAVIFWGISQTSFFKFWLNVDVFLYNVYTLLILSEKCTWRDIWHIYAKVSMLSYLVEISQKAPLNFCLKSRFSVKPSEFLIYFAHDCSSNIFGSCFIKFPSKWHISWSNSLVVKALDS